MNAAALWLIALVAILVPMWLHITSPFLTVLVTGAIGGCLGALVYLINPGFLPEVRRKAKNPKS